MNQLIQRTTRTVTVTPEGSTAHMTALLAGLGLSQTFRFAAQPHIEAGLLVTLLKGCTRPRHPLHVLYPPNRHLNAKLRVFVDWVAEVFSRAHRI
jgi:LysR family transcriptional regulator, regulator for bpeEF and oprC